MFVGDFYRGGAHIKNASKNIPNKKRRKRYDKKFSIFDTARNLAVFFYENGELAY